MAIPIADVSLIFAPAAVVPQIPSSFGIAWLSYRPTRERKSALNLSRIVAIWGANYDNEIISKKGSAVALVLSCAYSFIAIIEAITPSTFLDSLRSFVTRLFSFTSV